MCRLWDTIEIPALGEIKYSFLGKDAQVGIVFNEKLCPVCFIVGYGDDDDDDRDGGGGDSAGFRL